jgi:fluoroquinolone resistance protein
MHGRGIAALQQLSWCARDEFACVNFTRCPVMAQGLPVAMATGVVRVRPMEQNSLARQIIGETISLKQITDLLREGVAVALVECDLDELELGRLDLAGWRFERCSLRRADLGGARLERTQWRSCRGAMASFLGADLTDAVFTSCDINNAVLRSARLSGASFTGCKLTGVDLTEAKTVETHFEETLLCGAKLTGFSFRRQTLRRVDLSQADLRKADFRETAFEACSLRDAMLMGARFDKADLRGADLGGLRLVDASLYRGATISRDQAAGLLAELGFKLG